MSSDEMVEKAMDAANSSPHGREDYCTVSMMRAALEAVEPMLIAQGMAREALLGENARLVGIIDFMTAANAHAEKARAQGMADALSIARRTLIWSADQEAKFVDALRDAGMP